jgi:hypothetical protein
MSTLATVRPHVNTARKYEKRINNLYDVFENIRNDEGDHVKTMQDCQNFLEVK